MQKHDQTNPAVKAHTHSSRHRDSLSRSERCGCFYCLSEYKPEEIKEWTDEGTTALCLHCGVDSVIGSADVEFDRTLLENMHKYWFDEDQ